MTTTAASDLIASHRPRPGHFAAPGLRILHSPQQPQTPLPFVSSIRSLDLDPATSKFISTAMVAPDAHSPSHRSHGLADSIPYSPAGPLSKPRPADTDTATTADTKDNKFTAAVLAAKDKEAGGNEEPIIGVDMTLYCICRRPDDGRLMVCCDVCQEWFHGQCVGVDRAKSLELVEFHCAKCQPSAGPSVYISKRKSGRKKEAIDYGAIGTAPVLAFSRRVKVAELLSKRTFLPSTPFPQLHGHQFTLPWVQAHGFVFPVIVPDSQNLDTAMPPANMTVSEIANLIGDRPLEVMDVNTQHSLPNWTLFQWAHYFSNPSQRDRLLNVISFEISDTPLAQMVRRPRVVTELDLFWPSDDKAHYPRVQVYCLMSPAGCWTDFHIDFGGTSVFYHILSGEKRFYMIEPTRKNLGIYEKWCNSSEQNSTFLPDLIPDCHELRLMAGQTLFIPSGWIHGVFTPSDSIVIGGNFLHIYSMNMQLSVFDVECTTNVPSTYRFPAYVRLMWYTAMGYLQLWQDALSKSDQAFTSEFELDQVERLCDFLLRQIIGAVRDKSQSVQDDLPDFIKSRPRKVLNQLSRTISDLRLRTIGRAEVLLASQPELEKPGHDPIVTGKRRRQGKRSRSGDE